MATRKVTPQTRGALDEVQAIFGEFRNRHPGRVKIPLALRKVAVEAAESGISTRNVADAAGIAPSTVHMWRKAAPEPARELTLVRDHVDGMASSADEVARIVVGGVVIEFPVAAITGNFLRGIGVTLP